MCNIYFSVILFSETKGKTVLRERMRGQWVLKDISTNYKRNMATTIFTDTYFSPFSFSFLFLLLTYSFLLFKLKLILPLESMLLKFTRWHRLKYDLWLAAEMNSECQDKN